ncbi:lipocalin family protein [Pseudomonas oryzihabitans]|uniref:lipocalin family protein n=1 Tax=Pseudomonas oryzihabitans TaxID=47885 RepID=UPI003F976DA0
MKRTRPLALIALLTGITAVALGAPSIDPSLVGSWKGVRQPNGTCKFLSWKNRLDADGKFTITFFKDAEQTQPIQTEHGTWSATGGKNTVKTNGVEEPDVYTYQVVDPDTIHYVYATPYPDGACKEDYDFTERRIRDWAPPKSKQ